MAKSLSIPILLGCLLAESGCDVPLDRPARQITVSRWDTVFMRGVLQDDTLLAEPAGLLARNGLVFATDPHDGEILAFEAGGQLRWVVGRNGGGPGEFRRMADFALTPGGNLAVLDPDNARITLVDVEGRLVGDVPLRADLPRSEEFLPLEEHRFLLWTLDPAHPLAVYARPGTTLSRHRFPWAGYHGLHPFATQGHLAARPGSPTTWAVAFVFGDRWLAVDGFAAARVSLYPDSVPWPEIVTEGSRFSQTTRFARTPQWSGLDIVIDGEVVFVLANTNGLDGRMIDRYDFSTGRYLDTWHVPVRARTLAIAGGVVYLTVSSPFPGIIGLRPSR